MVRILRLLLVAFVTFVIIACAGNPSHESTGQYLDSSAVTTKVKARLVDQLGADGFEIQVKTMTCLLGFRNLTSGTSCLTTLLHYGEKKEVM